MGIFKFACATGVVAAAAGTWYLYRQFKRTQEQGEVNVATSLQDETLMVANDYMDYCIGIKRTPPSESAKAMRYLAKDVEKIYRFRLCPLVQLFLVRSSFNTWAKIRNIMLEVVGRERMSWGQVVTLFSFTGILAVKLSTGEEDVACSRRLAEILTDVLIGEKQEWMIENGGWRGFMDYVHTIRPGYPESHMKTALFAAANVAIAGIACLLIRYLLKTTLPGLVQSSFVIVRKLQATSILEGA